MTDAASATPGAPLPDRAGPRVPAPDLAEVARIWWDRDLVPAIAWDRTATAFWLSAVPDDDDGDDGDDGDMAHRPILLAWFDEPVADPEVVATALATTMAACDFPPTDDHASQPRVAAALRASRVEHPGLRTL